MTCWQCQQVSRALPYEFHVSDRISNGQITFTISNTGAEGAPFINYDLTHLETVNPRQYAVEAGKAIEDTVDVTTDEKGVYAYSLLGPNGFAREFSGNVAAVDANGVQCSAVSVKLTYHPLKSQVTFVLDYSGAGVLTFAVVDNAYGAGVKEIKVEPSIPTPVTFDLTSSGRWYDFSIFPTAATGAEHDCFYRRFMGRMENGRDSISDPAMGNPAASNKPLLKRGAKTEHIPLAAKFRDIKRVETPAAKFDKDAQFAQRALAEEL